MYKKRIPIPTSFGFCNFTEKIQNLWEWESFFYTFNIKNRTIYDMWHHGKSVEGVNSGFQCIKKSHKNLIWRFLDSSRAVCTMNNNAADFCSLYCHFCRYGFAASNCQQSPALARKTLPSWYLMYAVFSLSNAQC